MAKPISDARLAVVRAWQAARERGVAAPGVADLLGLSPAAQQLAETTIRILRVAEVSGAKSSATMFAWQKRTIQSLAAQAGTSDPEGVIAWMQAQESAGKPCAVASDLLAGFSATTADQILEALAVRDGEPVHEAQAERDDAEENGKGEEGQGQTRTERGSVARPEMLELWRHWDETAEQKRKEAADQARADERRVANAELKAAADRLAAEQRVAEAKIAAEREGAAARASAQRAQSRLLAIVGIAVALVAGTAIGIAYAGRTASSTASTPLGEGVHQAPAPTVTPPPPTTAIPTPPETAVTPSLAVPKDAEKPKELAQPGGANTIIDKP